MKDKWRAVKEAADDGGDCGYPTIVTLLLSLRRHHRHRHRHHRHRHHHPFSYCYQMDYPTNIMIKSHPYHSFLPPLYT